VSREFEDLFHLGCGDAEGRLIEVNARVLVKADSCAVKDAGIFSE
jgi:hypothetical protein